MFEFATSFANSFKGMRKKSATCVPGHQNRHMILRPYAAILAALMMFTVTLSAASLFGGGQQDDIDKMRKRFRKLEKQQRQTEDKIASFEMNLGAKKKRLKKKHEAAFDFETQKKVGGDIANWFNANPKTDSADVVFDANKELLVKAYGNEIVDATESSFLDLFAAVIEEKQKDKAPTDLTRIGRGLKDAFDLAFGKDYDTAFDNVLKRKTKDWAKLEKAKLSLREVSGLIDTLNRQRRASISARIPPSMVPVPKATGVEIGIDEERIVTETHKLRDETKRNFLLLWSTPRQKVTVDEFMLETKEVTHLAYWYFCQQTGHKMPTYFVGYELGVGADAGGKPKQKPIWKEVWPEGKVPKSMERLPVTWVSRDDADAYCLWTQSRLPTEFEWEVASRSGPNGFDGRFWPFGPYKKQVCNDATTIDLPIRKNASKELPKGNYIPGVVPVGSFQDGRNPLGIYDLGGSVAEFTSSAFVAYKGYTGRMKTKEGEVSANNDFNKNKVVIRGGHCDNRDVIVSSVFRSSVAHSGRRKKFVGFRRARSGQAGMDQMIYVMRNGRLDSRLLDFKLTKADKKAKRIFPVLDTRPDYYAIAEKFDWNEELQVPGKGSKIMIANRQMDAMTSEKWAKQFSKGDNDIADSLLIGMLHTDIDLQEPPIKAGTWFVSFKRGRKFKDPETKKKKTLKDALLFVPFKTGESAIRVDYTGTEITVQPKKIAKSFKTQITPIVIPGATSTYDKLELTWVFDIGRTGKKAVVEVAAKIAKGNLDGFK
ncbi:MAG: sulfatase activating formylglycine-generating enzyme [Planctomycetota bacterium]|jgi:formylglycine-generating enzyme required for sulfatase activity